MAGPTFHAGEPQHYLPKCHADTRAVGELTGQEELDFPDNSHPLNSETNATQSFCPIIILDIYFCLTKGRKWTNSAWKMLLNSVAQGVESVRDV